MTDALDTKNFDVEFTQEIAQDSYVDGPVLSDDAQRDFVGFSYNRYVQRLLSFMLSQTQSLNRAPLTCIDP